MAEKIKMPKLGNSVESCVIVEWLVHPGDSVAEGDVLCVAETDKAAVDVEAKKSGEILALLCEEGDEVPVYAPIAVIGDKGEVYTPEAEGTPADMETAIGEGGVEGIDKSNKKTSGGASSKLSNYDASTPLEAGGFDSAGTFKGVSPRARNLAEKKFVSAVQLEGTGPGGRVIERDVIAAVKEGVSVSPAAAALAAGEGLSTPRRGSGIGGRVLLSDVSKGETEHQGRKEGVRIVPVKGMRKLVSDAMLESITTTAQFTAHSSADASNLLSLKKRLKESDPSFGLQGVTITDLVIFAVSRTLVSFPGLNAHFLGDVIKQYASVHIGIAVDSPRGLLVPVLRDVQKLGLKDIARGTKGIYSAINNNSLSPDDLSGSTFTITNLGSLGIEKFTPILNIPEVAILGVNTIEQKPVLKDGEIIHVPHIGLSLTVNHQAVDGAPAARFLQALCLNISNIDLLIAL